MAKFRIHLTPSERSELLERVTTGKRSVQSIQYAHILLCSDEVVGRQTATTISKNYHISVKTVERIRKRFCEEGMEIFIKKPNKTRSDKKFDARLEAHLVTLCCQERTKDRPKWTLQLLADKLVELKAIDSITSMSVSKLLKKMNLSLSKKKVG